ncbi:MAG: GGDEF family protein [uncultured bacterium]|nr:MAG: GGDEF family protein [uncultured bacterium]OGT27111.1 MAG: hypothetical protein A3B71_08375 [Gammaproteobacteria bacterium RIFCSPHIGHO2_02_FULL_42_43]OGT51017.1 MAG: hypothetical protein A3E54_03715 [Gammaproteobacteria bacterium RIFCSPHIGHO2_12_FULL_41_25]OGT61712.1 MAG: hypothetical protein A3I77_00290 [Gammaproteobacteria bacterium RIFCSPLOWO2_02_FULL_42_14]OGT85455.1 MAG: hypothetical protein A3G86_06480 [Gammaproteobacteria bacterium RIFCSPLOWO2_12_FULL_42_18]
MIKDAFKGQKTQFCDLPIDLCCAVSATDHSILYANAAFESILGLKPADMLGQPMDSFIPSTVGKENLHRAFSKLERGVHSLAFEAEVETKNNLSRYIDWKGYFDVGSQHLYFIGRDITPYLEVQKLLSAQTQHDPLTGALTRPTFLTILQKELEGALRYHYPLSIIIADIDNFSAYAEKNGTQRADECLRQVAIELKTYLRRKTDSFARFENDAFIILLSHNGMDKGARVAEYLRQGLAKLNHHVTLSFGVAGISENTKETMNTDQLIAKAKQALDVARKEGGNLVRCL